MESVFVQEDTQAVTMFVPGAWSQGSIQFLLWQDIAEKRFGRLCKVATLWGHNGKTDLSGVSIMKYVCEIARQIVVSGLAPVHLVGHSMGGLICLLIANYRSELVKSVTTVCGTPPGDFRLPFHSRFLRPRYLWALGTGRAFSLTYSDQLFICKEGTAKQTGTICKLACFGSESGLAAREMLLGKWRVDKIKCPIRVITGTEDKICPITVQEVVARKFNTESHIFGNAGHMLHLGEKDGIALLSILRWQSTLEQVKV